MTKYFGDFWVDIYGKGADSSAFIEALQRCYTNQELQNLNYMRHINKALSRATVEECLVVKNIEVVYTEDDLNDQHYIFDGTLTFDGAKLFNSKPNNVFRLRLPYDIASVPFIVDDPIEPSIILQEHIDFECDAGYIYLREDIREKGFKPQFDSSTPPKAAVTLWFLNSKTTTKAVQRLYGDPIKALSFNDRRMINIYWDMLIQGCSEQNLRRLLCAITDTDYLREAGTVGEIFLENGRYWVNVNDSYYTAPEAAGVLVQEGDEVAEGQFLFGNAAIYDSEDEIPVSDFPILHLSEAMTDPDMKGGVCVENKDTDIPGLRETLLMEHVTPEAVEALLAGEPAYIVSTSDGYELIQYVSEPYVEYQMVRIRDALPFRGTEENIDTFLDKLNTIAIESGKNILNILIEDTEGARPTRLNLFEQYRKNLFGTNAVFISIKTELAPEGIDPAVPLAFLKRVLNAGTAVLTFYASESIVEYPLSSVSDSVDTFLVPETLEEDYKNNNIEDVVSTTRK